MPTFSGDKALKIESFLFQFSRIASRRGWRSPKKASRLVDLLSGDALDYAKRLDEVTLNNYGVLKTCPTDRFSIKLNPKTARKELSLAKQGEKESLEGYAQRLMGLGQDGYCDLTQVAQDQIIVECFLRGMQDKAAAMHVLGEDHKTVNRAMKLVKEFQANNKAIYGQVYKPFKQRNVTFSGETDLDDKIKQSLDQYFRSKPVQGFQMKNQAPTDYRSKSPQYDNYQPGNNRSSQYNSDRYGKPPTPDFRSRSPPFNNYRQGISGPLNIIPTITENPLPPQDREGHRLAWLSQKGQGHLMTAIDIPVPPRTIDRNEYTQGRPVVKGHAITTGRLHMTNRYISPLLKGQGHPVLTNGPRGPTVPHLPRAPVQSRPQLTNKPKVSLNETGLGRDGTGSIGDRHPVLSNSKQSSHPDEGMAKPPVVVRELKGMSLVVDIVVNGHQTEAVVDTAATITLVSDKFYSSLPQSGKSIGNVVLKGLADVPVNGKLVPNMNIRLGHRNYKWNVCVAPMSDNVILGIDFLKAYAGLVDFGRNVVAIDGQILPAKLKVAATDDQIHISRVHICKRVVIPPETIGFVQCSVDSHPPTCDTYIFQPLPAKNGALISSVYASGTTFNVKVVNDSNTFMTFKKDRLIGLAEGCTLLPSTTDHVTSNTESDLHSETSVAGPPSSCQYSETTITGPPLLKTAQHSATCMTRTPLTLSSPLSYKISQIIQDSPTIHADTVPIPDILPEHLQTLYTKSSEGLTLPEQTKLRQLLIDFSDVFACNELDLGCLKGVYHHIDTGTAPPVKERMRRTPLGFQEQEREHLQKLINAGVIEPSSSEWASAPVLVRKRDGAVRYCLDYRQLNLLTVKDRFPIPNSADCLDTLQGTKYFSCLDMAMGYYQIQIHPDSKKKTAFVTKFGEFQHIRLAFGLCNSPATFQRAIQLVLRGLLWEEVLAYLDDIIVLGKSVEDSLLNLQRVLERFRQHNLKLKPAKCKLLRQEVEFLGKTVSEAGVQISPSKVETVRNWPLPTDQINSNLSWVF